MQKISNRRLYVFGVCLLVFCIFQSSIGNIYGFSLYPDEFGYWASAARVRGYDWSRIASLGSYYSFGYSLILMPIVLVFGAGVTAYRAAVAVNYAMVAGCFLLLLKIADRITDTGSIKSDKKVASGVLQADEIIDIRDCIICAIGAFYPPLVMYSQMTMVETEIVFLYILLSYLVTEFAYKPGVLKLIFGVITCIYMYSVHMRTIGVVIATMVIYMAIGLSDIRLRRYIILLLILATLAVLVFVIIKRKVIAGVFAYASSDELKINDYGSQMWKIRHILTPKGFGEFITELLGKVYYLVISSLGMLLPAVSFGIKGVFGVVRSFRDNKKTKKNSGINCVNGSHYLGVFLLLCVAAEIAISAIYMHGSDRADSLFYGRYDEFLLPVVIVSGIYELLTVLRDNRLMCAVMMSVAEVIYILVTTPLFLHYLNEKNYEHIRGFFVSGIGYLNEPMQYSVSLYMWNIAGMGIIFVGLTGIIVILSHYMIGGTYMLGLLVVAQIILGFRLSEQWTYRINSYIYPDLELVRMLKDDDRTLFYLDIDDNYYVDFLQFNMPKREFAVVGIDDLDSLDMKNGYLIVNWNYEGMDELKSDHDRCDQYSMFNLIYDE